MAATITRDAIVPCLLDKNNYEKWSIYMKNYLMAQHLWSMVEHGVAAAGHLVSPLDKAKNAAALHAIHIASSPDLFAKIKSIGSAKDAWDELAGMCHQEEEESERDLGEELDMTKMDDWVKLRQGIWKGEWVAVEQFLHKYPVNTVVDGTALHLAIDAGQEEIAEKLVEMMSETDLEIKNTPGDTALQLAAFRGRTNSAKCLVQKCPKLLTIAGEDGGCIPILSASNYGREEMVHYLYTVTPHELLRPENGYHGFRLLSNSINGKMFDFCLKVLQRNPELAISNNLNEAQSPIDQLSTQPSAFYSGCRLSFWQRMIYHLIKVERPTTSMGVGGVTATHQSHGKRQVLGWFFGASSNILKLLGIKDICNLKLSHLYALEVLQCMCNYVALLNHEQYSKGGLYRAMFKAAKHGTYEFLTELWTTIPASRFYLVGKDRNVLMVAIQYRQEKVFQLFYDMSETWKTDCVTLLDRDFNSIWHVAGELAPDFQLSRISGAALQMQRELQWFKEVERITSTCYKEVKNRDGLTARELFTKTHKELLKEGEKWMKDTASSFIIAGALIVTIMFAVAFTVPGGNKETGLPIFLGKRLFNIFLISDAISFFAAATSILMFLGILTSRYAEDDFLVSLPTKLIIGLSALFISTAAMMLSFSVTLLIMLRGQWWAIIPIILMASIPVALFVWLQFPLLVRIFVSTYGSGISGKK